MKILPCLSVGAALVVGATFFACDDDTAAAQVDYAPLLDSLTESVMLPEIDSFAASADALDAAVAALDAAPTADTLTAAQTSWRSARAAYRLLDALYFGPVADLGIGDRIDSSPASSDDIDAVVAGTDPINATTVADAGGASKGFLGMEYLLFAVPSAPDGLGALQGDGAAARRRSLVHAMADEVASSAHQLADAWSPDTGGFATQIETAGAGSTRYPSQRAAMDEVVGGVGYALELIVGVRLAQPLGRKSSGQPMPSLDPTSASDSAVRDMSATLAGINALYGGSGLSSRVQQQNGAIDARIAGQLAGCGSTLSAIPAPFDTTIVTNTAVVQTAYTSCQAAKTTWNTDVTSALGATLLPTDNDGD
jgi:predicted lipoprotein